MWLTDRLDEAGSLPALAWHDTVTTYAELGERVRRWHSELDILSVTQRSVVALIGDYSPSACALLMALIERGAVAVPLTASAPGQHEQFLSIAEAGLVITFDRDDTWFARRLDREPTHPLVMDLATTGHGGLVFFSSGSTGAPKAALHDVDRLLEKFRLPRPRRTTVNFLLLDHMGGVNTLFHALANGSLVVVLEQRDPESVCAAIARHRAAVLPTSPTFLNMLIVSGAYKRHDLSSLELITYGTEVMPETTLRRVHDLFPGVRLLQTYGLSEVGVLRSKSKQSASLWVRVGGEGFETKVVDDVLWIRASSAMLGYLNAPSPFDSEGWMNTQDEVQVDGDHIRILGRRSDLINVGGQKVYPAEVEDVLLQVEGVEDVVVFGEAHPLVGQIVVARFKLREPEETSSLKHRVREFCRGRLEGFKVPQKIEVAAADQVSARFKKVRRS